MRTNDNDLQIIEQCGTIGFVIMTSQRLATSATSLQRSQGGSSMIGPSVEKGAFK